MFLHSSVFNFLHWIWLLSRPSLGCSFSHAPWSLYHYISLQTQAGFTILVWFLSSCITRQCLKCLSVIAIGWQRNLEICIVENISVLFRTIRIKKKYRIENPKEEGGQVGKNTGWDPGCWSEGRRCVICWSSHNHKPQTRSLKQLKLISHSLEAGIPTWSCQHRYHLLTPVSLACKWTYSCCFFT